MFALVRFCPDMATRNPTTLTLHLPSLVPKQLNIVCGPSMAGTRAQEACKCDGAKDTGANKGGEIEAVLRIPLWCCVSIQN